LSDQRVSTVRTALIKAGLPTSKIQTVPFDDRKLARHEGVAVLIRTAN